jgi:hypothetical protein
MILNKLLNWVYYPKTVDFLSGIPFQNRYYFVFSFFAAGD